MSINENSYKLCPSCNYFCNTKELDQYCPLCGEKLYEECPECKNSIYYPYAVYCKFCGSKYPGRSDKKKYDSF